MKNYEYEEDTTCRSIIRTTLDIKKVYEVLYDYCSGFCKSCIIDADSEEGLVRIRLPYKDSNGKRVAIFCNPGKNDNFLFTDDGYFVEELEKIGIHKFINSPLTIHIRKNDNFTRCFDFYLNIFRRMNSLINRSTDESLHALSEELEDISIKRAKEIVDLKKRCYEMHEIFKREIKTKDDIIKGLQNQIQILHKKKKLFRIKPLSKKAIHIEFSVYKKRKAVLRYCDFPSYMVDLNLSQSRINQSFICPDTGNLCLGEPELSLTPDQIWYILFEKEN